MLNPDGESGAGYGTTFSKIDGPSKPKLAMGHKDWPYGWEDKSDDFDYNPDDFGFDELSDIDRFSNKIGHPLVSRDPTGGDQADRRSFVDGSTRGISDNLLRKLIGQVIKEDAFRLRGASVEPDSLGYDAWPGAADVKFPVRPERREPAWTLKSVFLRDEDQLQNYEGDGDPDDPASWFAFQESTYE